MADTLPFHLAPFDEGLVEPRLIEDDGLALRVGRLAEPVLRDFGFRLVRVKISAAAGTTVQVMAERPNGVMTIDDCEQASIGLAPVLEIEEIISHSWRLEMSSPGIDRPLVRKSDFERAIGHEARVEMAAAVNGRKRFRGRIEALTEGPDGLSARLALVADDKSENHLDLPIRDMAEARLVLTEDLIRAALRREKAALKALRRAPSRGRSGEPGRNSSAQSKRKAADRGPDRDPDAPDHGDPYGR